MRGINAESRGLIELGMETAAGRLVDSQNSPLNMGVTMGLVNFVDGDAPGFHFVCSLRYSPDFNATGFPKDLWLAYASYLEEMASNIRSGELDVFLQPNVDPEAPTERAH